MEENSNALFSTSTLVFTNKQKESVGIALTANKEDKTITLAIYDHFTGRIGCSTTTSLELSIHKTLKLIDGLYDRLGVLEDGEIIEGEFYPENLQSEEA